MLAKEKYCMIQTHAAINDHQIRYRYGPTKFALLCGCRLDSKIMYPRLTSTIRRQPVGYVPRILSANSKRSVIEQPIDSEAVTLRGGKWNGTPRLLGRGLSFTHRGAELRLPRNIRARITGEPIDDSREGAGGRAVSLLASHQDELGSLPDFREWESCRAMPLVGGFSRDLPFTQPFHSGAAPYSPRFTLRKYLLRHVRYEMSIQVCEERNISLDTDYCFHHAYCTLVHREPIRVFGKENTNTFSVVDNCKGGIRSVGVWPVSKDVFQDYNFVAAMKFESDEGPGTIVTFKEYLDVLFKWPIASNLPLRMNKMMRDSTMIILHTEKGYEMWSKLDPKKDFLLIGRLPSQREAMVEPAFFSRVWLGIQREVSNSTRANCKSNEFLNCSSCRREIFRSLLID
ncbi:hypothetical protein PR048_007901 [Dryococelus australis]|uniref:Uncharacterized protein n=1 Tax=Dryococelus australis TaxID=614101 RepID=A0ABQ9HWE4_9NEOP|nr:hypothetical protein PR048_007901 [Dryococelus australis]